MRMIMTILIEPATIFSPDIDPLVAEADADGHLFMRRLRDEYASHTNRFDRPGELLLAARMDGRFAGICGLNIDPFAPVPGVGRLRRLYVARAARRFGVGSLLVRRLLAHAAPHFTHVRLRTDSADAAAFYMRLGFQPTAEEGATHIFRIG